MKIKLKQQKKYYIYFLNNKNFNNEKYKFLQFENYIKIFAISFLKVIIIEIPVKNILQ